MLTSHLIIKLADGSAGDVVRNGIAPTINMLSLIASILCTLFLIIGGYYYITSAGDPSRLGNAKRIIKNAIIGIVIVLAALTITGVMSSAYGPINNHPSAASLPQLNSIKPNSSSGIIVIILKTISGVLGSIIEAIAGPFLKALTYFTSGTPLISANGSVFNLWLSTVAVADALFVLVVVLIGLHVMSFASIGIEEINLKQLLPRLGLGFLLINSSLFLIDSLISLSNLLIKAISNNQAANSVWQTLSQIISKPSVYDLAALIIMVIFLVFSVILIVYYVGRLVILYVGAVLAPLILLCWLLPSTRDFAISAAKRYIITIFVLFVHVVILEISSGILGGLISKTNPSPDPLMSIVVGLATLVALLKTQGVMAQLAVAAVGPRIATQIGQKLVLGLSYIGAQASQTVGQVVAVAGPSIGRGFSPSASPSNVSTRSMNSGYKSTTSRTKN